MRLLTLIVLCNHAITFGLYLNIYIYKNLKNYYFKQSLKNKVIEVYKDNFSAIFDDLDENLFIS